MRAPVAPPTDDVATRAQLIRALADPTRLRVLDLLGEDGPRCHCELEAALDVPANRLSFHLRVLREAGLVGTSRRGRRVDYHLEPNAMAAVRAALPSDAGMVSS